MEAELHAILNIALVYLRKLFKLQRLCSVGLKDDL
jgi:hypothetical protein